MTPRRTAPRPGTPPGDDLPRHSGAQARHGTSPRPGASSRHEQDLADVPAATTRAAAARLAEELGVPVRTRDYDLQVAVMAARNTALARRQRRRPPSGQEPAEGPRCTVADLLLERVQRQGVLSWPEFFEFLCEAGVLTCVRAAE